MTTKRASKTAIAQPDQQTHPRWCDPTRRQADDSFVDDRRHSYHGEDVALSLYDRLTYPPGIGDEYTQTVCVTITQDVAHAAPTLGIWSETAGHLGAGGFDLDMTRAEFVALHAEMGRAIEATA